MAQTFTAKLIRWGDSPGFIAPQDVVDAERIKEGNTVHLFTLRKNQAMVS
jgi:antitoxin component of MazEF toxin-antitoxin module